MSLIPIDHASARGIVSDVQPPSESLTFYQQPEQTSSDRLPRRHQPDHQSPFESHINMDSVDVHHQYKHPRHNHYLHHHHIQPQPIPHHHFHQLPVPETYFDTGDGLITSDVNSVSCDIVSRIEKEKQGLPHKIHADQCAGISVHMSFKPCEDGCVSIKTHEETSFPPTARSEVHTIPGRHENFNDGRCSHSQLYPFASSLFLVAPRIKLLCSIGGRIMGRPADGTLRYCGGDNRLISVEHGIRFSDLLAKLSRTYGPGLTLKYQLPGEDLDALVSVSSDDDLQNMLDEYDRMVAKGNNSWFRLFLFQKQSDLEASFWFDFGHGRGQCCSQQVMQRYIDAINGFDAIGVTEKPTDVLMENNLNGCVSTSRVSSDTSHTTLNGPCLTTKAFSLVPSASPSVPSSPSGASRQVQHKQCCTGDTCLPLSKEQQNSMFSMNGLDTSTQEPARDCHVDVLKFEHYQSHLQGECLKMQHESPYNRCDASGVKENGTCIIDTLEPCVYHRDRHQGTGTAHMGMCHSNPKVGGITEPQCEARCGYHRVSQPVTSVACHGGQVDTSFCGCEPAAHSFVEQHKQCLHPHHLHQTGPPLPHWEGPFRSQKAPDSVPVCQIGDDQGLHHLVKAPVQVTVQNTSRTSPISLKTLGSAPSSPRNACLGRCGCCHQHFQVDRGINVSLGEHSYSQKPSYVEGHMNRRHGGPLFSSYSDGPNICSDSDVLHCVPMLAKHVELDEQEYDTCPRKQALHTRNNNFCHPIEHSTNENAASSLMEPMHCLHEGGPAQNQVCRANFHNAKGQQLVNSKVFSAPEGQIYMGQLDPYSRNHKEGIMSRGWPYDLKSDASVERVSDTLMGMTISNGPEIPSLQNVHGASGYAHVQGSTYPPIAGHKELHSDLTSQSFSSTDAIAGSLTSLPLEPAGWVGSPPAAIHNQQSKETECGPPVDHIVSFRHFVDGTVKHESLVDTSRTPSLDCIDCHTKAVSVNSSANAVEPNAEISPVISFTSGTEDKCSLLTEDKMGTSYVHGSQSKVDDSFHPLISSKTFAKKTLGPADFKGSATFPMPVYDQSPISSIANAPGFSQHAESKSVSLEKETNKPGANNSNASKAFSHQNHGGYEEMAKTDADSTHRISEHKTKTVLEESRPNSKPSSSHCSLCLEEKTLETVPVARSSETNQTAQEVNVSGSVDACSENDEELPATQAEAEAITRGLQIIKNDDLEDLKELGSGTYGTVFHGKWRGSDVAIKRIKPSCFMGSPSEQERLISDFWREAGTLSQLHHPNIVAFYGVVPDGPEGTLATVTEYMVNGSLKQVLMKKDRTIDRRKRLLIAMDAAFGMEYLHSKRIVHFDLKSENLLVNMRDAHRPICKVGDFGLSKVKHQTLVSGGVRGTLPWMAPELLDTKGRVTEKVDVYSFGIVMWELLTGEEPYAKMHCGTIIGGIVHNNLRPAVPSWCDPSWRDLMERCWSGNPSDRPDFSTVASELRAIASSMNVK